LTQEEVRDVSDVVAGTLPINNFTMLVLFELGATHSFITRRIVTKYRERDENNIKKGFKIGTPTRNRVEIEVNLMPLELHD
jgi:hypothetical protein